MIRSRRNRSQMTNAEPANDMAVVKFVICDLSSVILPSLSEAETDTFV